MVLENMELNESKNHKIVINTLAQIKDLQIKFFSWNFVRQLKRFIKNLWFEMLFWFMIVDFL